MLHCSDDLYLSTHDDETKEEEKREEVTKELKDNSVSAESVMRKRGMINVADVRDCVRFLMQFAGNACVTQIHVRTQQKPMHVLHSV